jgi:integrase/recombinase XerD
MKENMETLSRYLQERLANGFSRKTLQLDEWVLSLLIEAFPEKRFEELTKDDLVRFCSEITAKCSPSTSHIVKAKIKRFYAWLYNCEPKEYPECVKWMRTNNPKRGTKTKGIITSISLEDVLKDEDVKKLVEAAEHPRDKALIMVLYESGAEAQELLNMKIKDVIREREAVKVALHGETGVRYIRIHYSTPYLFQWLNIHPKRDDPDASLWNMKYSNLDRILKIAKKKAGIQKPVSARALRHACLTKWAKIMPEQLLKLFAGWRPDSKMASVYVHLSGADLDETLAKAYGEQPLETKEYKIEGATPKECPRCREKNPPENLYCYKCGFDLEPLPYDATERRLRLLLEKPEIYLKFIEFLKKEGLDKEIKQDSF